MVKLGSSCVLRRLSFAKQGEYREYLNIRNFQQHVYQPRNYPNELLGDQHIGPPFFGNYRTQEGNTGGGNTGKEEGVGQDYYDHRIPIDGQPNFLHPFAAGNE